jgi:hypothetical protein
MKAIIKNLRNGERERIAYCPICGNENSADKSDYFMAKDSAKLICCSKTMNIVRKEVIYTEVKQ